MLHDLNLAAQYADHLVVLAGGRVLTQGAPAEVLTPEVVQTAFDVPVLVQPHPWCSCSRTPATRARSSSPRP